MAFARGERVYRCMGNSLPSSLGHVIWEGVCGMMNQRNYALARREQAILAKLADMGIPLDSPDADLRRAFKDAVSPTKCFRLACEMRDRVRLVQDRLL